MKRPGSNPVECQLTHISAERPLFNVFQVAEIVTVEVSHSFCEFQTQSFVWLKVGVWCHSIKAEKVSIRQHRYCSGEENDCQLTLLLSRLCTLSPELHP